MRSIDNDAHPVMPMVTAPPTTPMVAVVMMTMMPVVDNNRNGRRWRGQDRRPSISRAEWREVQGEDKQY